MWERFEMDPGFEHVELFDGEDVDEDEAIDAASRRFWTISPCFVGPTDPKPFYDDGDEAITNAMRNIGNTST